MTTAADWVLETEQHVTAGAREVRNRLASAVSDTTGTTLTFTYDLGSLQAGSVVAVDLEVMHVWAVDSMNKQATVERGQYGSTAATHSSGSMVYVNPNHTKFSILRALNQELQSLSSAGLFTMSTVDLTDAANAFAYDLAGVTNVDGIYEVTAKYSGLTDDWEPVRRWSADRNENTTDFPSGYSLTLREGGQPGQAIRVKYRSRLTNLTDLSTNVTATNLPASAYDIPPLGAAARLVTPREVGRNNTATQGDTRRAEEVPAGAVGRSAAYLWQLRQTRLGEELTDLRRLYPNRTA